MIPAWLQRLLDNTGRSNNDGISRRARAAYCRKCGKTIMRGLDNPVAGIPISVDPEPLNRIGEVVALLGGKTTYTLTWQYDHYELDYRTAHTIENKPAGEGMRNVLAEHACGTGTPPLDPRGVVTGAPARLAQLKEAPF